MVWDFFFLSRKHKRIQTLAFEYLRGAQQRLLSQRLLCLAQVDNNGVRVCPRVLRLSVNIKDTAGCCVFRKQVSVHKQLINKSHPSLSRCVLPACRFYGPSVLQPAALNAHKCLLHTRQQQLLAQWHNCDAPSHDTALSSTRPQGSAGIFLDVNGYKDVMVYII